MTIPLSGGNWKMKLNHLCPRWQTRMDLPSLPFWKPIRKHLKKRTHRNQPRMSSKPRCFDFETAGLNNNWIWTLLLVPFTAHLIFHLIKYGNLRGCTIAEEVLWVTGSLKNAWFSVLCIIWDTLYRSMALLTWESWWLLFQPSQWFEEAWPSRWFMGWGTKTTWWQPGTPTTVLNWDVQMFLDVFGCFWRGSIIISFQENAPVNISGRVSGGFRQNTQIHLATNLWEVSIKFSQAFTEGRSTRLVN